MKKIVLSPLEKQVIKKFAKGIRMRVVRGEKVPYLPLLRKLAKQLEIEDSLKNFISTLKKNVEEKGIVIVHEIDFLKDIRYLYLLGATFGDPVAYGKQEMLRFVRPRTESNPDNISAGRNFAELHTDKSFLKDPPSYLLLQCERKDRGRGGRSIFADAYCAYRQLKKGERERLSRIKVSIRMPRHISLQEEVYSESILNETRCRFRGDLVLNLGRKDKDVVKKWLKFMKESAIHIQLQRGDIAFIDNKRILHGRSPLSGSQSPRILRRLYAR